MKVLLLLRMLRTLRNTPLLKTCLPLLAILLVPLLVTPHKPFLGKTPKSNTKVVVEKVVVGQSPMRTRHIRKSSMESSSSFSGLVKEIGPDYYRKESPRPSSSFKKMEYFSQTEIGSNLRKGDNIPDLRDDMSDRVYTIDSIHLGTHNNNIVGSKSTIGVYDEYVTTPRDSLYQTDIGDPDIKKLYARLQMLEADRESMKQAIISTRTEKAHLVILKELAQQLYRDMSPERKMHVRKSSLIGTFPFLSVLKWLVSLVFWKNNAQRSKYMFGLSASNVGLLLLLEKNPHMRQWRCLTRAQM